jgi:hypothetical protein
MFPRSIGLDHERSRVPGRTYDPLRVRMRVTASIAMARQQFVDAKFRVRCTRAAKQAVAALRALGARLVPNLDTTQDFKEILFCQNQLTNFPFLLVAVHRHHVHKHKRRATNGLSGLGKLEPP